RRCPCVDSGRTNDISELRQPSIVSAGASVVTTNVGNGLMKWAIAHAFKSE
ncbi:MAG: hypothetical protein F6K09_33885, partial [Merismopedia sp. SIO2A8]|nr:hypothetical protein [Merismopedia sp. SIO2A8]